MLIETRIPAEILCEIFLLLCHDQYIDLEILDNPTASPNSIHRFPWSVGQVCRRWRETFISHPPLWTSLSFSWESWDSNSIKFESPAYAIEVTRRTAIYIRRSRHLPLAIAIELHNASDERRPPLEAVKMLVSCSNRWKDLFLSIRGVGTEEAFLECKGNLPILTSVSARLPCDTPSNLSPMFEVAPQLTKVDMGGAMTFPWAQLTELKMYEPYWKDADDLFFVLSQLQNLETLRLDGALRNLPSRPIHPQFTAICLPRLLVLKATLHFSKIFPWFTVPLLKYLKILVGQYSAQSEWDAVFSLLHQSSCCIHRLALTYGNFNVTPMMRDVLADVEELSIENPSYPFPEIVRYISGFDGHTYLPKLRVLEVAYCPAHHDIEELAETVSRILEVRGKESTSAPAGRDVVALEKLVIRVEHCRLPGCPLLSQLEAPGNIDGPYQALEAIRSLQSNQTIFIHKWRHVRLLMMVRGISWPYK